MQRKFRISKKLSFIIELFVWVAPTTAFLHYFSMTADPTPENSAWGSHFSLIAAVLAILIAVRLILWRTSTKHAAWISPLASTLLLIPLWAYYGAVVVGLDGWGRVITWPILRPYLFNISGFLDYLQISQAIAIVLGCAILFLTWLAWWLITGPRDWTKHIAISTSRLLFCAITSGLFIASSIHLAATYAHPPVYADEPLTLTFYPLSPERFGEKLLRENAQLAPLEDASRSELAKQNLGDNKLPNVIVIVSDALRADRLSIFGYARDTSPNLTRRLKEARAVYLNRATSVCAETYCAMPGLLYSKPQNKMHRSALGLPEVLKAVGYKSYVLLSGDHTNYYGLAELYGPADVLTDATTEPQRFVNDDLMVVDAANRLPKFQGQTPVYMQFLIQSNHPLGVRWQGSDWYKPYSNYARWPNRKSVSPLSNEQEILAGNYYDNGVRQADIMLDKLLSILDDKEYLNDAIVLITADHGEMLGEHGVLSHTVGVYQPVLDIPAVFIGIGRGEFQPLSTKRKWISQTDLGPTIIRMLGMSDIQTWAGVALQEDVSNKPVEFQQNQVSGFIILDPPYVGYKYWIDTSDLTEHVYDLNVDFGETRNLATKMPINMLHTWRRQALDNLALNR